MDNIDREIEVIKKEGMSIKFNTNESIKFILKHPDYIKYSLRKSNMLTSYNGVIKLIENKFGKINRKDVYPVLLKMGIIHHYLIWSIILFISSILTVYILPSNYIDIFTSTFVIVVNSIFISVIITSLIGIFNIKLFRVKPIDRWS